MLDYEERECLFVSRNSFGFSVSIFFFFTSQRISEQLRNICCRNTGMLISP